MCVECEKFNNIEIKTPGEIYMVAEHLKDAVKRGALVEIEKESIFGPISIFTIEENKPWPSDIIEAYFKCVQCNNEIKLFCETYHGSGGSVKFLQPN